MPVGKRSDPEGKEAEKQLACFIAKFKPEIGALARAVRAAMRKRFPTALELVYENYNALAIGFAPTEKTSESIFSIALYPNWVSLFFLQARELPDPKEMLKGTGKVARHIVLSSWQTLDDPAVEALIRKAAIRAKVTFNSAAKHQLIIKSVSARQRPRRPPAQ